MFSKLELSVKRKMECLFEFITVISKVWSLLWTLPYDCNPFASVSRTFVLVNGNRFCASMIGAEHSCCNNASNSAKSNTSRLLYPTCCLGLTARFLRNAIRNLRARARKPTSSLITLATGALRNSAAVRRAVYVLHFGLCLYLLDYRELRRLFLHLGEQWSDCRATL